MGCGEVVRIAHMGRVVRCAWSGQKFLSMVEAGCPPLPPAQAMLVRIPLTILQYSILSSIITGIGGSLSTVSTWVVEVQEGGGDAKEGQCIDLDCICPLCPPLT